MVHYDSATSQNNIPYTAKNAQVATSLLTSCDNLLQQADITMRSHGLRQLVDDLLVPSVLSKLVINYGKFFQQVVASLEMTN